MWKRCKIKCLKQKVLFGPTEICTCFVSPYVESKYIYAGKIQSEWSAMSTFSKYIFNSDLVCYLKFCLFID